jgi:hypothetical protein
MHTATLRHNSFGITGVVEFDYHGWHQELVRDRTAPDDLVWASDLLGRLSDRQWADAFRAGGYTGDAAGPFIQTSPPDAVPRRHAIAPTPLAV